MTRIVVTGAAGYLGGAVSVAAGAAGAVRPVTRRPAPWLPGMPMVCEDLVANADAAVEGADAVVHLAGANEVVTREDPDAALAATAAAARAVGVACRRQGVPRLVYVSTIHVYGESLAPGALVTEDAVPAPRSAYSIARLTCEHLLAAGIGDDALVVLRLSNVVGAPADLSVDRWSLLANDLCQRAAQGRSLELRTPGQLRDFIALADVTRMVLAACDPNLLEAGTYNLASGSTMTVAELANLVADESEHAGLGRPEIVVQSPPGGPLPGVQDLGGQPPTGLPLLEESPVGAGRYRIDTSRLGSRGLVATVPLGGAVADTLRLCSGQPSSGQPCSGQLSSGQ